MTKTFTDDSGNKYELKELLVGFDDKGERIGSGYYALRPIKPLEVKKEWEIKTYSAENNSHLITIYWDNKEQAEALRDCVEELMGETTDFSEQHLMGVGNGHPLVDSINKARAVFQKEQ